MRCGQGGRGSRMREIRQGSWSEISAWGDSQKDSQEFIRNFLQVMAPLDDSQVLRLVPLAHPSEWPEQVPDARPQSFLCVAVDLTHTITVLIHGPCALG